MLDVEITLSDWVFNAIEGHEVLTINRRYFQLRKPLERRFYELARKHCGQQKEWRIKLKTLRDKCGSGSTLKEFKRLVSKIMEDDNQHNHMPDYSFSFDGDTVVVRPKNNTAQEALPLRLPKENIQLKPETYEKAKANAPGWDVYMIEQEWREWITEPPRNADTAFLGFCKKWYEKRGPAR